MALSQDLSDLDVGFVQVPANPRTIHLIAEPEMTHQIYPTDPQLQYGFARFALLINLGGAIPGVLLTGVNLLVLKAAPDVVPQPLVRTQPLIGDLKYVAVVHVASRCAPTPK